MTATRPARRPRRGATLIEVVVIVGCVGVILSLCGGFLHVLLALDRSGRAALSEGTTVARLGRQFRADVRAAAAAKVVADGAGLELSTPGGPPVTYREQSGRLVRVAGPADHASQREAYTLHRLAGPRFEADGTRVILTLPPRGDASGASQRPAFRVEARLDKDRSLVARKEAKK